VRREAWAASFAFASSEDQTLVLIIRSLRNHWTFLSASAFAATRPASVLDEPIGTRPGPATRATPLPST